MGVRSLDGAFSAVVPPPSQKRTRWFIAVVRIMVHAEHQASQVRQYHSELVVPAQRRLY